MRWLYFLFLIFLITPVFAEVLENNYFYEGKINADGTFTTTAQQVNDVNVIGYVCDSPSCSSVSARLWEGETLSSDGNYLQLIYPETLASENGYGVYAFKEGYLPLEIHSDWSGNGSAPGEFARSLYKIESCSAKIASIENDYSSGRLRVTAVIDSPIQNFGPLEYMPSEIEDYYKSDVNVNMKIFRNDRIIYREDRSIDIAFSESSEVVFTKTLSSGGDYDVQITTSLEDEPVCINFVSDTANRSIDIEQRDRTITRPVFSREDSENGNRNATVFTSTDDRINRTNQTINLTNQTEESEESSNERPSYLIPLIIILFIANVVLLIILYFMRG